MIDKDEPVNKSISIGTSSVVKTSRYEVRQCYKPAKVHLSHTMVKHY
jgi:hypothetical protein